MNNAKNMLGAAALGMGVSLAPHCVKAACNTELSVELHAYGQTVELELRQGTPGNSKIIGKRKSDGKPIKFSNLCAGSYFLAIGNEETVDVTPVHQFKDNMRYRETLETQQGIGNLEKKSKKNL